MKLASIVFLARRIAGNAASAVARSKNRVAGADATVQRIKAQIGTRRAMMDVALRKKRFKRGK
jgi:hypothetical protein